MTGAAKWCSIGWIVSMVFQKKERLLFHQVLRTHYLIADNKLTTDEWRKIREYAKEKGDYFAQLALAEFQKKRDSKGSS